MYSIKKQIMKKNNVLLVLTLLFSTFGWSQEIKDQTEILLGFKQTEYLNYLTQKDESGKYLGGIKKEPYHLVAFKTYRVAPNSRHKEVYLSDDLKCTAENWYDCSMYLPDNEAFPVTYVSTVYEGNKKLKEGIGYTARTGRYAENRAVFLENKIYLIEEWKGKDDYKLKSVLEVKEGKISGFKLLKLSAKSPKKMAEEQPKAKLQAYLDAATAKQEKVYAEWIKNPVNKGLISNKKDIAALMKKTIKKMSDDWLSSDEFKRIQKNNRLADEAAARSQITIQNNSSHRLCIAGERSGGITYISAGSSTSFSCDVDIWYIYDSNRNGISSNEIRKGTKFYTANSGCGTTVTIN